MKCDLCKAWFETHQKTYSMVALPTAGDRGAWKKNIRGAIKNQNVHVCVPCINAIQDVISVRLEKGKNKGIDEEPVPDKKESTGFKKGKQSTEIDNLGTALDFAAEDIVEDFIKD